MRGMFGVTVQLTKTVRQLERAKKKGTYKSLRHAAFSIRKSAVESMPFAKGPSEPGKPPHAHKGKIRRSILVAQDEGTGEVFVGPSYPRVKAGRRPYWLAQMLEHGGTFTRRKPRKRGRRRRRGESPQPTIAVTYPARPFMHPALKRNLARFHRDWEGAIA